MNRPRYLYISKPSLKMYEFTSEGPKGFIKKMVQYTDYSLETIYNPAFGDYDEETKCIDDLSVTNNNNGVKVSATVASTVYDFTEKYPEVWMIATGSTHAETRLYRKKSKTTLTFMLTYQKHIGKIL